MEGGHIGAADGILLQQVVDQPGRGVAAKIFGYREEAVVAPGRRHHQMAALHRDGHGFFHHYVQPQIQRLAHYRVVYARIHDDVHGVQIGDLVFHFLQIGKNFGPLAQELLGFIGSQLGVIAPDIAYGGQFDVVERRFVQFCQAVQMPGAHAAATHQGRSYLVHFISSQVKICINLQ